jgi:aryl-alcohol dehydrogenase-like predicted oxidoreductase
LPGQIGFGAMRITGPGIWGPPKNEGEAIALLRRAVEKGVTFIDTADSYGPGISETLIAKALHPYPAGLVLATKGGLAIAGPVRRGAWMIVYMITDPKGSIITEPNGSFTLEMFLTHNQSLQSELWMKA